MSNYSVLINKLQSEVNAFGNIISRHNLRDIELEELKTEMLGHEVDINKINVDLDGFKAELLSKETQASSSSELAINYSSQSITSETTLSPISETTIDYRALNVELPFLRRITHLFIILQQE